MTPTEEIISRRSDSRTKSRQVLEGDRVCVRCGYNLVGQRIIREEHYSLLIVRCPECATVTSLQEYPHLAIWGKRWGLILAALWMILIVGLWPASSGIFVGFTHAVSQETSSRYAQHLRDLRETAEAAELAAEPMTPATDGAAGEAGAGQKPGGGVVTATQTRSRSTSTIVINGRQFQQTGLSGGSFQEWWDRQDHEAVYQSAGGWRGAMDPNGLVIFIPAVFVVFVIGCVWSVLLMQVPRRWLVLCVTAIVLLAGVFMAIPISDWAQASAYSPRRAALYQMALPTVALSFTTLIAALSVGLCFGRTLARLMTCAILPPRLRGPLSLLWTAQPTNR